MRTRKPAASSSPACHRCTAVLFTGVPRCGMCGWPAGVGYPPAEGELDQATSPEAAAPAESPVEEPDHVGAQLDALAGMIARKDQPSLPVDDPASATEDSRPEKPVVEDVPGAVDEPDVLDTVILEQTDQEAETATEDDASSGEQEIDPLTAPLAALTGATVSAPEGATGEAASATANEVEPVRDTDVLEPATGDAADEGELPADTHPPAGGTAGRAAAILRPAQLLLVATAALNLILVGLNAVLGTPSGSGTVVVLGAALITLTLWTGAAVTFLHWVSRAHSHVAATAKSRQRHGASMSLLGWFIPIAGFVIGYRVLQDLWTGSDPMTRHQADAAPAKVRTIDIWLLGIVTAALFGYAMPLALGEAALWGGLSALGLMVAALSLASTMGTISAWQLDASDEPAADDAVTGADTPIDADVKDESDAGARPDPLEAPRPVPTPQPVSASAE